MFATSKYSSRLAMLPSSQTARVCQAIVALYMRYSYYPGYLFSVWHLQIAMRTAQWNCDEIKSVDIRYESLAALYMYLAQQQRLADRHIGVQNFLHEAPPRKNAQPSTFHQKQLNGDSLLASQCHYTY